MNKAAMLADRIPGILAMGASENHQMSTSVLRTKQHNIVRPDI